MQDHYESDNLSSKEKVCVCAELMLLYTKLVVDFSQSEELKAHYNRDLHMHYTKCYPAFFAPYAPHIFKLFTFFKRVEIITFRVDREVVTNARIGARKRDSTETKPKRENSIQRMQRDILNLMKNDCDVEIAKKSKI